MADITSSDTKVTVRLHTAWSSVLLWTTMLTGTRSVIRNGATIGTIPAGGALFYDHYAPIGVAQAYQVTDGTTTSTTATITIPTLTYPSSWVKSAVNPVLSTRVAESTFAPYTYEQQVGQFKILGGSTFTIFGGSTYSVYGAPALRSGSISCIVTTASDRDDMVAAMQAGRIFVQRTPAANEPDMLCAATKPTVTRRNLLGPGGIWVVSATVTEEAVSVTTLPRNIIPGWGWSDVTALYATWTAEVAANTSWLELVKRGVV